MLLIIIVKIKTGVSVPMMITQSIKYMKLCVIISINMDFRVNEGRRQFYAIPASAAIKSIVVNLP